jgi:DNA-binding response OmpR family regulator
MRPYELLPQPRIGESRRSNAVSVVRKFLIGQKILVAEDNGLVAADTIAILEDAGAEVFAAARVREAVDIAARANISAAVLDIDLAGAECTPVCEILERRQVPFVFYTGQYDSHVMDRWSHAHVVLKPALSDDLLNCVDRAIKGLQPA